MRSMRLLSSRSSLSAASPPRFSSLAMPVSRRSRSSRLSRATDASRTNAAAARWEPLDENAVAHAHRGIHHAATEGRGGIRGERARTLEGETEDGGLREGRGSEGAGREGLDRVEEPLLLLHGGEQHCIRDWMRRVVQRGHGPSRVVCRQVFRGEPKRIRPDPRTFSHPPPWPTLPPAPRRTRSSRTSSSGPGTSPARRTSSTKWASRACPTRGGRVSTAALHRARTPPLALPPPTRPIQPHRERDGRLRA